MGYPFPDLLCVCARVCVCFCLLSASVFLSLSCFPFVLLAVGFARWLRISCLHSWCWSSALHRAPSTPLHGSLFTHAKGGETCRRTQREGSTPLVELSLARASLALSLAGYRNRNRLFARVWSLSPSFSLPLSSLSLSLSSVRRWLVPFSARRVFVFRGEQLAAAGCGASHVYCSLQIGVAFVSCLVFFPFVLFCVFVFISSVLCASMPPCPAAHPSGWLTGRSLDHSIARSLTLQLRSRGERIVAPKRALSIFALASPRTLSLVCTRLRPLLRSPSPLSAAACVVDAAATRLMFCWDTALTPAARTFLIHPQPVRVGVCCGTPLVVFV